MADQGSDHIDTDYSGRPYRLPTADEIMSAPRPAISPYDVQCALPDGRRAVRAGDHDGPRYYLLGADGWPDWDRPVWIERLSPGEPAPEDEVIPFPLPDADRT